MASNPAAPATARSNGASASYSAEQLQPLLDAL
jgi:hypothetical protein